MTPVSTPPRALSWARRLLALFAWATAAAGFGPPAQAQTTPPALPPITNPEHDAALAARTGADERGMRPYVLVILKTGPTRVPAGPARDDMFKGHFANMNRLAKAGQLVLAGPLDGVDGWRGLFILAVKDLDEARALVATDPVVQMGEMVPELHRYYGSAGLVLMGEIHAKLSRQQP